MTKITKELLSKLIKEGISDRLANINTAGDEAAKGAKITKLEEERNIVEAAKSHFSAAANILKDYVSPKSINMIVKEIDGCIKAIENELNKLKNIKKNNSSTPDKKAAEKKPSSKPPVKAEK